MNNNTPNKHNNERNEHNEKKTQHTNEKTWGQNTHRFVEEEHMAETIKRLKQRDNVKKQETTKGVTRKRGNQNKNTQTCG